MDRTNTLYGTIAEIVFEETRYLKHYVGKVSNNVDPDKKHKVQVTVPELGWDSQSVGAWCFPRVFNRGLSTPKVGEYVEIYFLNGDKNRPVYLAGMGEMSGMLPTKKNNERDHVLFELNGKGIIHDDTKNELTVSLGNTIKIGQNAVSLELNGSSEKAVLGNKLITWLGNFITLTFNAHTHTSAAPGAPTSTPTPTGSVPVEGDFCSTSVKVG